MPHEHCDCFIRVIECSIRVSRSGMQFREGGHFPQMPHPGSAIALYISDLHNNVYDQDLSELQLEQLIKYKNVMYLSTPTLAITIIINIV